MIAVTCINHPDIPADVTGADYGPPLCEDCTLSFGLPPAIEDVPIVVALCGSTRFMAEIGQVAKEETVAGRIVLRPECDVKVPDPLWPGDALDQVKARLDRLHRAKIQLADEVLVVAPGGYVGSSTRAEISYARRLGRRVRYWPDDRLVEASPDASLTAAPAPAMEGS